MKDKEKQIIEIANLIYDNRPIKDIWQEEAEDIAKTLYNSGYRKLPENARVFIPDGQMVLLTKEEMQARDYEFRQIGYDECLRDNPKKDKYIKTLERKIDQLNAKLDQVSKETAEKFESELKAFIKVWKMSEDDAMSIAFYQALFEKIGELTKQFGVEIKE